MLTKTRLKEECVKFNFKPLKRFGENYLIDANVKDRIISEALIEKGDTILEIGPGLGALTMDLAASGADIYAVEKDQKAFLILKELAGNNFKNLRLFNEDILEFSIKGIFKGRKIRAIGSLPYYITTPIIEYLITNRRYLESFLIVIQKEVALRLLAKEGSEDRGSISCFLQYYTKPSHICTVRRNSFYPIPDVDSSLLRFEILDRPPVSVGNEELFFKIIRGSFNQRRKSIINSLSRREVLDMPKEELSGILSKAGVSPSSRPEDLSLQSFARIAEKLTNH